MSGLDARAARILVAGVGNILRGDDGFGPSVIEELERAGGLGRTVRIIEVGIGGIGLVQELMEKFEALIVIDAVDRGSAPGELHVFRPEIPRLPEPGSADWWRLATDLHEIVPARALLLARALGVLPGAVRMVGCQPAVTDDLVDRLTPPVARAVPAAVREVRRLVAELSGDEMLGAARNG